MWTLREATAEDVPQINNIVNWYIRETTVNWSWEERTLAEAEAWFEGHKPPYHPVFVVEEEGAVLAFGSLSHFRPKAGYWPVAENSVYVRHDCRGRGFGKELMNKLIDHAKGSGLRAITAWINDDNDTSIRLHEKLGFYHNGKMMNIGEKFGKPLSVIIMQLDLPEREKNDEQGVC